MPRPYEWSAGRSCKGTQHRSGRPYHGSLSGRTTLRSRALAGRKKCPSNGIWLCQNRAKLVDNDPARFAVALLRGFKAAAEAEAKNRIGETAPAGDASSFDLKVGDRVLIEPIVPRRTEQSEWMVESSSNGCLLFQKAGAAGRIEIPASFIEKVHRFGSTVPALVRLSGRLQWISVGQQWRLFPEKPASGPENEHGFTRNSQSWCVMSYGESRHRRSSPARMSAV
jgi:hypothetical protein